MLNFEENFVLNYLGNEDKANSDGCGEEDEEGDEHVGRVQLFLHHERYGHPNQTQHHHIVYTDSCTETVALLHLGVKCKQLESDMFLT